jgi:hypothetical protein
MRTLTLLCITSLGGPLLGQTAGLEDPRGPFHTHPHYLSLATSSTIPQLALKPVNDLSGPNYPYAAPPIGTAPNLNIAAMFPAPVAAVLAVDGFDGIASGNDRIPNPGTNGELDPDSGGGTDGWLGFTYSVTPGSVLNGSIMALRPASDRPADLYSHFLITSSTEPLSGLPPEIVGTYHLEQGREHMNLPLGADLDGHDAYLPAIREGGTAPSQWLARNNKFYFSITRAGATALRALNRSDWTRTAHAADIYEMTWTAGAWTRPIVFRSRALMGLMNTVDGKPDNENIDALAVFTPPGSPPGIGNVIISTDTPGRPVLLVQGPQTSNPILPPKDREGRLIRLVDIGDVDAITVYDPEVVTGNQYVGTPVAGNTDHRAMFGSSMACTDFVAGNYVISASGFRANHIGKSAYWFFAIDGIGAYNLGSFTVTGHTVAMPVTIPFPPTGLEWDVWVEMPLGGGVLERSWRTRILR